MGVCGESLRRGFLVCRFMHPFSQTEKTPSFPSTPRDFTPTQLLNFTKYLFLHPLQKSRVSPFFLLTWWITLITELVHSENKLHLVESLTFWSLYFWVILMLFLGLYWWHLLVCDLHKWLYQFLRERLGSLIEGREASAFLFSLESVEENDLTV